MVHVNVLEKAVAANNQLALLKLRLAKLRVGAPDVHLTLGRAGTAWENLEVVQLRPKEAEKVLIELIEACRLELRELGFSSDAAPATGLPDQPR